MKLSRHARNELRMYRIDLADVEMTIAEPAERTVDERGNARLVGASRDGRRIVVVVAQDDPGFVITVFVRS